MGRIRNTVVTAMIGAAIAAQGANAQNEPPPVTPPVSGTPDPGTTPPPDPAPAPPKPKPKPEPKPPQTPKPKPKPPAVENEDPPQKPGAKPKGEPQEDPKPVRPMDVATLSCDGIQVPQFLIPIYQRASRAYHLGPSGPAILTAINEIETNFGQNQGPSYAGAVGWMQFMPATWAAYGVDANGDGVKDPANPEDAIHAAARYLSAAGMPADPEAAIWAYNHADWYVQDVLERAACYYGLGGFMGDVSLTPQRPELSCLPAEGQRKLIPPQYLRAFERAAARYGLGEEGVWALAAVARLESNFGRGMKPKQLRKVGPLNIDASQWKKYGVDGDGDGRLRPRSPGDSAATLARSTWSRDGDLEAGVFSHNQAAWYVDEVMRAAAALKGECKVTRVAYSLTLPGPTGVPINWENVTLSNDLEVWDVRTGAMDPRIMALIAAISKKHSIVISSMRSDHSMLTVNGGVSNHYYGRAIDISMVDGVSCTVTGVNDPCGVLTRELAALEPGVRPTELIFCFDADGAGRDAFAAADHCDHIHAGYDS